MANAWFRMYSEFSHDPKVQMMSEAMQRRLLMLMCMHCDGSVTSHVTEIAFHWRISDGEVDETKALFIAKGFIDEDWNLIAWNKRQFISDSSSERTKRYRERRRTSQERHSDTRDEKSDAPEQNRTEQIQKKTESHFVLPDWLDKSSWQGYEEMRKRIRKPMTDRARELAVNELEKLRSHGEDPAAVLNQSTMNGWQGLFELRRTGANVNPPPQKRVYIA